ncbi:replication Fork Protection Component Swi3 [Colletotrichum graminicola]|uniref:Chromosome segregation in meiosis protein n=1 Tax=Colletotrichum graminicola (strain M1.001 / M2 / FGSC 10212) TaxID=645133 RepID=E3Q7M7_COLGM|nr:replication Fork Protection Component Swi3 [Colletotrichum graminicola M1.001]EFQ26865.1 replication Fork Protection Component Swi3 [Colletotrichum graminicola M1.001]WDK17556.1 replication Fork Protection Component Swi3 [Colletotrichum graminicola]
MDPKTSLHHDDLDNYNVDDFDDPFQSPPPEVRDGNSRNKRKKAEALGLDEEVEVAKRVRVPRVKLDETRLLSENGIPKLRKRATNLRFKGRGHEFSDAARLLAFYQLWLDDLFPKAKFLDALAMVEKAGHKKQIALKRMDWINEGKPKPWEEDDDKMEKGNESTGQKKDMTPLAPAVTMGTEEQRPITPEGGYMPDDHDIYGATPLVPVGRREQERSKRPIEEPEDDDLDALMAEAEAASQAQAQAQSRQAPGVKSVTDDFADEEAAMAEMDGLW